MVHRDDLLVVCMSVRLSVSQFVDLFLRGRGQGGGGNHLQQQVVRLYQLLMIHVIQITC